jgi:NitT/TauT family transport system substrate-binding protein
MRVETVASILKGPNVTWTIVPENNQTFATFMHAVGSIKGVPATWRDLFFAEIHNAPGS